MSEREIREILNDCCNDLEFSYGEKDCSITSTVTNYIPTYYVWNGDDQFTTNDVNEVMQQPLFNDKALKDIIGDIDIWFS